MTRKKNKCICPSRRSARLPWHSRTVGHKLKSTLLFRSLTGANFPIRLSAVLLTIQNPGHCRWLPQPAGRGASVTLNPPRPSKYARGLAARLSRRPPVPTCLTHSCDTSVVFPRCICFCSFARPASGNSTRKSRHIRQFTEPISRQNTSSNPSPPLHLPAILPPHPQMSLEWDWVYERTNPPTDTMASEPSRQLTLGGGPPATPEWRANAQNAVDEVAHRYRRSPQTPQTLSSLYPPPLVPRRSESPAMEDDEAKRVIRNRDTDSLRERVRRPVQVEYAPPRPKKEPVEPTKPLGLVSPRDISEWKPPPSMRVTPAISRSGQVSEERRSRGQQAVSAMSAVKNAVTTAALTTATHVLNTPGAEAMKAAQAIKFVAPSPRSPPLLLTLSTRPGDFVIALMGVTGAGKTSFIQLLTDESVTVGKALKSCTTSVGIHRCRRRSDRRTVWLVDTPGFDDTYKSDADILKEIASWLVSAYDNQIFLTGIIYLHPIQDMRVRNSTMRNLRMFKKLVGPEGLARVVLATTFWGNVGEEEGREKERQLCGEEDFWGYMLSRGSQVYRHYGTVESATVIVDALIHHQEAHRGGEKMKLAIQQEVAVEGKLLNETEAGRSLEDELRLQRLKFEEDLKELREALLEAIEERDRRGEREAKREADEVERMYHEADPSKLAVEVKRGMRCCVM